MRIFLASLAVCLALATPVARAQPVTDWAAQTQQRDIVLKDFRFADGEILAQLRMHVMTLGTPHRGAGGNIDNAVMILHGTGGTGATFLNPVFADELFKSGQPLDIARYYLIIPDNLGHGKSSKPSDGMRMAFPKYDYADMVLAEKRMLSEGLQVDRLELILGTSMGCMQAFVWGETYPGFARRLAPFACNAVEIGGRNRMWRKMAIDAIEADPAWHGGNYTAPPAAGLRTATDLTIIAGANPLALQDKYPTRLQAETALEQSFARITAHDNDANDQIYQLDASRNYNPAALLARITVPVLWVNSGDDFINPPELGLAQQQARQMPRARFVLIPQTPDTKGHGTHTWAKFWKADLAKLLAQPAS